MFVQQTESQKVVAYLELVLQKVRSLKEVVVPLKMVGLVVLYLVMQ